MDPSTGEVFQEGDHYYCTALANTLETVAKLGPQEFYSGNTAFRLISDMEAKGGRMTLNDLKNYRYGRTLLSRMMAIRKGPILFMVCDSTFKNPPKNP